MYVYAILLLPLLFLVQNPHLSESVHGFSLTLLKPLLLAGDYLSTFSRETRNTFVRLWKTFQDQAKVEYRIAELESQLVKFSEISKENERLKEALAFRDANGTQGIAARVIRWDPASWRKMMVLDKGTRDGIKKDTAVAVLEGLIGRILESGPSTSRLILLIDPDSRVSAITNDSRAQGIMAGNGSDSLKMIYLELESGVQVGETVLSSGTSGLFPKGIPIGKITAIEKDFDGLHLNAVVQPFVRFSKLEEVVCLASFGEK